MTNFSVEKLFMRAKSFANKGLDDEAIDLYKAILNDYPNNKRAKNSLKDLQKKVIHVSRNRLPAELNTELTERFTKKEYEKIRVLTKELKKKYPEDLFLWNLMGAVANELNDMAEAKLSFEKAIVLAPENADVRMNMGQVFLKTREFDKAIESFNVLLSINPNHVGAFNGLGLAHVSLKKFHEAITNFKKALSIEKNNPQIWNNLGSCYLEVGENDAAIFACQNAVKLKIDHVEALFNLGTACKLVGRYEEASSCYKRVLSLGLQGHEALFELGNVSRLNSKYDQAIEYYRKVIKIAPKHTNSWHNLGLSFQYAGQLDKAVNAFKTSIKQEPKFAKAHNNLGVVLQDIGEIIGSRQAYQAAVLLDKNNSEYAYNLAQNYLLTKDFIKGFKLYEHRWQIDQNIGTKITSSKPEWSGEKDKKLLVYSEQGIGDVIMFSSIITEVRKLCSKVIIGIDNRLISLFKRSFSGNFQYISDEQPLSEKEFDFHIPIGSLPLYFRKNLQSFKQTEGAYLIADETQKNMIRRKLSKSSGKPICGISWKGGSLKDHIARTKDVPIEEFSKILSSLNFEYVSLQYGAIEDDLEYFKDQFGVDVRVLAEIDNFNDLDGLCSLISACDQVITVDNLTDHLAGALGINTCVLIPFSPTWRWGMETDNSYWHSKIRLFRQQHIGQWREPIEKMINFLKNE